MNGFKLFENQQRQMLAAGQMAWDILVNIEDFDRRMYDRTKEYSNAHPLNIRNHLAQNPDYLHAQDQIKELRILKNRLACTHIMMGDIHSAVARTAQAGWNQEALLQLVAVLERYPKVISLQRPRHDIRQIGRDKDNDLKFVLEIEREADNLVRNLQKMVVGLLKNNQTPLD